MVMILIDWIKNYRYHLIFDAKERGTFHSARWSKDYNPDLCISSTTLIGGCPHIKRKVLEKFPHSQHRALIIDWGICIPVERTIQIHRWNFAIANWEGFAKDLDLIIKWILPNIKAYNRFSKDIIDAANINTPRGRREEYVPG